MCAITRFWSDGPAAFSRRPRPAWAAVCAPLAALLLATCGCGGESFAWQSTSPESQGLDATALEAWADGLEAAGSRSVLVIRNDRIVLERHAGERTRASGHFAASLAKGVGPRLVKYFP